MNSKIPDTVLLFICKLAKVYPMDGDTHVQKDNASN